MAKKVNYLPQVLIDGVPITENNDAISYIAETSADNLAFHQQYFIIEANTNYETQNLSLRDDAVFTYFFEQDGDIDSEVTLKFDGNDTEFNVSPDLWIEESIESLQAQNQTNQDRLIYVYQLYTQEIVYSANS